MEDISENIDNITSDVWNWIHDPTDYSDYLDTDFDEDEDDIVDFGEMDYPAGVPVELLEGAFIHYNDWCKDVSQHIEVMTNFLHCIETVGFETMWRDYWLAGVSPEDAARKGLVTEILLEHE